MTFYVCVFVVLTILGILFVVFSLTEYVQVDKQLLEDILKEVGALRKLADSLLPPVVVTDVAKEVGSCSVGLVVEQKVHLQV